MSISRIISISVAAFILLVPLARADEITDSMDGARSAYDGGRLVEAKRNLDTAIAYLNQRLSDQLRQTLPPASEGWTATDGENDEATSMFMGGIEASREYVREDVGSVKITVFMDSPLATSLSMILSNPQIAIASGAALEMIAGNNGAVMPDGTMQIVVSEGRVFIMVEGSGSVDDKRAYATAINFGALQSFQ